MKQKKFILPENEIPTQWYNIQAEMPNKPQPMLNPKTGQPVTPEDLYPSCSAPDWTPHEQTEDTGLRA